MTSKQANGSKKAMCLLTHGDIQNHCTSIVLALYYYWLCTWKVQLKSIIYSFQKVLLENFPAYFPGFVIFLLGNTFFKYSMWAKIDIPLSVGVYSMEKYFI